MRVVVDANLIAALVLPLSFSAQASHQMKLWLETGAEISTSALWSFEVTSTIRKYLAHHRLEAAAGDEALDFVFGLDIQEIPATEDLQRRALHWASRLEAFVAYDGSYLAVAEALEAEFWTADRKLVRRCRELGVAWIHDVTRVDLDTASVLL